MTFIACLHGQSHAGDEYAVFLKDDIQLRTNVLRLFLRACQQRNHPRIFCRCCHQLDFFHRMQASMSQQ